MNLRRERYTAELLDPRHDFERRTAEAETRWDPLTGRSSRILPAGSLQQPAALDVVRLEAETREGCPFCAERIDEVTPRFPPELVPEGRIRRGEALLFPNLAAYATWSAVSVYSPGRHALALDELTPELVADNLAVQVAFGRAVVAHDPACSWLSVNANHLPPSGSSIFHPHLQGSAHTAPTTAQRLWAEVPDERVAAYLELERGGERWLGSTGRVDWVASFAPVGPGELRAFVAGRSTPAELDDALVGELARGLSVALGLYAELGFQSFNLALHGPPLVLRLVARAYYGPQLRSDAMWSERLHGEAATDLAPERLAALAAGRLDE